MRICIQFSWPEDADLIWLRNVTGRRFPCVIRDCVTAWANGLPFTIDTPLEVPASAPVPHEAVKTIIFIEDDSAAGRRLSKAQGKPALIRDLLRGGAGDMFRTYADKIWEKSREPLSVDVRIPKKYADSFVSSVFRSPGDYERSLYLAVSSYVNGAPFDRDPSPPDDRPIIPPFVTVRFNRERDGKILEVLSGIPEALRGCFLRNILHVAVTEAQMRADDKTAVVISGEPSGDSDEKRRIRRRSPVSKTPPETERKEKPVQPETESEDRGRENVRDRVSVGNEPVPRAGSEQTGNPEVSPETVKTEKAPATEEPRPVREDTGTGASENTGTSASAENIRADDGNAHAETAGHKDGGESTTSEEQDEGGDALFDLLDGLMGS